MEPQEILLAFNQWKMAYLAIHGSMTCEEVELVNGVCDFIVNCAQAQKSYDLKPVR